MTVKALTQALAEEHGLPADEKGVVIVELDPSGQASRGLAVGDGLRAINQMPTRTLDEFKSASRKARLEDGIVFDVNRQGREIYVTLMGE